MLKQGNSMRRLAFEKISQILVQAGMCLVVFVNSWLHKGHVHMIIKIEKFSHRGTQMNTDNLHPHW